MLYELGLSTLALPETFLVPNRAGKFVDYALGGEFLGDNSKGLLYQVWSSSYTDNWIQLWAGDLVYDIVQIPDVVGMSFALDQNCRPVICYEVAGTQTLRYFDGLLGEYNYLTLPEDNYSPYVFLDEHRYGLSSESQIYVTYFKGFDLYCRVQSERFAVEHVIAEDVGAYRVMQAGVTRNNRIRWRLGSRRNV